jgi:hypothetical protein
MWILMYAFSYSVSPAATNDRTEWRLLPTIPRIFKRRALQHGQIKTRGQLEGGRSQAEKWFGKLEEPW